MNTTELGIRDAARALPTHERTRRMHAVRCASDAVLLRAVLAAGIAGGEWKSASDCAERAFVVDDRKFRRWLADDALTLTDPARLKLERLAWAFGVEIS